MLLVFEVHLAAGCDGSGILSEEMQQSTQAQIMTLDEARAVGFSGLSTEGEGGERVRLIVAIARDRGFLASALERSPEVTGFRVHEVET
jgi:hypothetical protein